MDYKDLFEKDEFKCIEKEKLSLIIKIAESVKGKSAMEAMEVFTRYQKELTGGKALSPQEKNAILEVIKISMSEPEKKKFSEAVGIMRSMGYL